MIGLRITCDADGCERHFEVDALVEGATASLIMGTGSTAGMVGVDLRVSTLAPRGWEGNGYEHVPRLYCADHAGLAH